MHVDCYPCISDTAISCTGNSSVSLCSAGACYAPSLKAVSWALAGFQIFPVLSILEDSARDVLLHLIVEKFAPSCQNCHLCTQSLSLTAAM